MQKNTENTADKHFFFIHTFYLQKFLHFYIRKLFLN